MIQTLLGKYRKRIACFLLLIFCSSHVSFVYADRNVAWEKAPVRYTVPGIDKKETNPVNNSTRISEKPKDAPKVAGFETKHTPAGTASAAYKASVKRLASGGPGQPEMASFKPIGADNMVNLFTGDFSYNIPLMDVGGYPVNIFYDANISMEQEASWVGLGWNINPGTINRNMRGIPDDFGGEEQLIQTQKMKPNTTWGVSVGADLELIGIKDFKNFTGTVGASLGLSVNNYLGPALELGIKGTTALKIADKAAAEKDAASRLGAGIDMNLSSRSGLTLSPKVSLTANAFDNDKNASIGLEASTSYNSRVGIKSIQIAEQTKFNTDVESRSVSDYYIDNILTKGSRLSTSITFAKPSYIPSVRMPVTNTAYAGRFQLGGGIFGVYGSVEAEVYKQSSEIAAADVIQYKPMVGYLYYQKAKNNANAVMDFTRFNDNEVTPNTPIISMPQYTYDVFSIQGEGTGGSIRAYRNDAGYVRDNLTQSQDKSLSIGADVAVAPPGHFGANVNTVKTPTSIGEWADGNKLRNSLNFKEADTTYENVYFRNPGENCVLINDQFKKIGGTELVRFKLGGTNMSPTAEPTLERFSKAGKVTGTTNMAVIPDLAERTKKTQVIQFLTAEEASKVGLDTVIRSYNSETVLSNTNTLLSTPIPRFDGTIRRKNHISQINVTESNGSRYVYGLPVYNIKQKDFTFSVDSPETPVDKVAFTAAQATANSPLLGSSSNRDGFVQITETPAYAHSFLLTGLLSTDYVDVKGDGITEDDLGSAVKFNYTKVAQNHIWRTPLMADHFANFNAGKQSDPKDDKGLISYGERESWYLHSIESKTMIALFTLENREDGKGGVKDALAGINAADTSMKRLRKIDLYNKADLKKNGLAKAKPIKTVHFQYSYNLCKGTSDNTTGKGKLTLDGIYFTYNGQNKADKNRYVFSYNYDNNADVTVSGDNPAYYPNESDRWGTYKRAIMNPGGAKNSDFPFSLQDKSKKSLIDQYAGAWALKKILLPSGGQIEVQYESDDYAFVQNKRAANMTQILGFGNDPTVISNRLYDITGSGIKENSYVFIRVPETCASAQEVFQKYLSGQSQLALKMSVNMPRGSEYITSYAGFSSYGLYAADNTNTTIWIKLNEVDGISPLSLTAAEFLRQQLPGQAFTGYDVSESTGLKQAGEMLLGMLDALKSAFKNPLEFLRSQGKAQTVDATKSFVRLNDPDGYKYGGGHRVKTVKLKDNWNKMTGQYTSEYGQEYNYETTEVFNGTQRTVSSGVASYEPAIGGEENPFHTILQVENKLPLGPASYGAVELPVPEAFFPAPLVGYGKVTVKSLRKSYIDPLTQKTRSGIGKQVTEFYTAKDFPVYYSHTPLDASTDKQAHTNSFGAFFYTYAFDSRALSQGFVVEINDMHGKLKSQASYAENDEKTPVSFTQNFYRNTGERGLDEKFDFVSASQGGVVSQGNMGIDVELMTDTREFSVNTKGLEIQGQVDLYPVLLPVWLPFIWPVTNKSENTYRAVTTTKVINYHAVLDSVVVIDKGSMVSTKNLVYDAETGNVAITRTNNEFDQPVYTTSYPAYWAYSGMGPAYRNADVVYKNVNFKDGKIVNGKVPLAAIESGDELHLFDPGSTPAEACAAKLESPPAKMLWAFNKNKNTTSLTDPAPDFVFMDDKGRPYTKSNVSFKIVRSGKRNMLNAEAGNVVSMNNPIVTVNGIRKIVLNNASNAVNASAVEYKEKWQTDNDVFRKIQYSSGCSGELTEILSCNGEWERAINPYRKGLLGNFKAYQSKVLYTGRSETDPKAATNISRNGYIGNFKHYWNFNLSNNLVPDATSTQWVYKSETTRLNAVGLELETKNALNIYTAAQYGFNKTLPVAVAENARYDEIANESFEDIEYNLSLNGAASNPCTKKHILDFTTSPYSNVINTDTTNFTAHTGKYVLALNAYNGLSKDFTISKTPAANDYTLSLAPDTIKKLYNYGGTVDVLTYSPAETPPVWVDVYSYGAQNKSGFIVNCSGSYDQYGTLGGGFNYQTQTTQYMEFPANGNYDLKLTVSSYTNVYDGTGWGNRYGDYTVYDSNGDKVYPNSNSCQGETCIRNYSLCKGVYKIVFNASGEHWGQVDPYSQLSEISLSAADSWDLSCMNYLIPSYANLDAQNGCAYSKPIAAKESMQNPTFTVPAGKPMVFSAWVKENCNNESLPCKSKITLQFVDFKNILDQTVISTQEAKPTGPLIEGWQRYEIPFTAPLGANTLTVIFQNNSNGKIYFDDIRFHPFNANMKTYVYDPVNLRLAAELDANNYAVFYEYDEEGTLIRTKAETQEGIKTLKETRSAKQKTVTTMQ